MASFKEYYIAKMTQIAALLIFFDALSNQVVNGPILRQEFYKSLLIPQFYRPFLPKNRTVHHTSTFWPPLGYNDIQINIGTVMIIDKTLNDYKLPVLTIKRIALEKRVDAKLIAAIILVESGGNQYAQQYQPNFHYFYNLEIGARVAGHTYMTERVGQATSHGLMQIMGSTARGLGFEGPFGRLYDPEVNIRLGAKFLLQLQKKYPNEKDMISAYNMGTPRKDENGLYINQYYVDRILKHKQDLEIWF